MKMVKKKKTNTRLISNNHDRTSLVNNGFLQGNRYWLSLFRHGGLYAREEDMIAGYWILAEFFFFRISSLYQEASMIGLFQEPRKKATVFVAQHSTRVLYVFFVLTLFCNFLRLHRWHCPRITNFVSLRGIKAGNPERARGTHLCRLGNQSKHFAYKNIISFFRGRFIDKTYL